MSVFTNKNATSLAARIFLLPAAARENGGLPGLARKHGSWEKIFDDLLLTASIRAYQSKTTPGQGRNLDFFSYCAAFVERYGGLFPAVAEAVGKFRQYGPRRTWFILASKFNSVHDSGSMGNILVCSPNSGNSAFTFEFISLLQKHSFNGINVLFEKNDIYVKAYSKFKKKKVTRLWPGRHDAAMTDFLYELGDNYQLYLVTPELLEEEFLHCLRYISPTGKIICLCADSSELAKSGELAEKLDLVICKNDFLKFSACPVRIITQEMLAGDPDVNSIFFMRDCGLIDYAGLRTCCAALPFPPMPEGKAGFSICINADQEFFDIRSGLVSLLTDMAENGHVCEIILWGQGEPAWIEELKLPCRFISWNRGLDRELLKTLEKKCQGECIAFLGDGQFYVSGTASALPKLVNSPEPAIFGCRSIDVKNRILQAGVMRDEKGGFVSYGKGEPADAHFYRITRTSPLASTDFFLFRKKDGIFSNFSDDVLLAGENNQYIGFNTARFPVVVIPDLDVCDFAEDPQKLSPPTLKKRERNAIRIAALDDYCPQELKINNGRPLNILYYSPYPSHPASHGNRSTIQHFGRILRQKGCRVHFALLGLDRYSPEDSQAMREAWDSLTILPYPFQDFSHLGEDIAFDGWYTPGLGEHIAWLCDYYKIDMIFCSYVFQSRMLEFVPRRVLKVIDTHDRMTGRYAAQKARGIRTEFFSCSEEDEGRYLRRADVVVARRQEEADWFNAASGKNNTIVIPHVEKPQFLDRPFEKLEAAGLVASANIINLGLVTDFLTELEKQTPNPPFKVRIAGQVKDMVKSLPQAKRQLFDRPWIELLGFVENIRDFYESVELVISPVIYGTGINVKTVQAMSFGMPLLTTACGSKGIETDHPLHCLDNMEKVVRGALNVAANPAILAELARKSRERYSSFFNDSLAQFDWLLAQCGKQRH